MVNKQRLAQMVEIGRQMIQRSPGSTHEIRNAIDTIDRFTPTASQAMFGRGAPQKNAEVSLANAGRQLCEAIMNSDV